jgi:hypothetical protein
MTDDFEISMHRLNPTHKVDDEVLWDSFLRTRITIVNYYKMSVSNYS